MDEMRAWKFLVRADRDVPVPNRPELSARGCVAVAVAPDAERARALLVRYAAERGFNPLWLDCVPEPIPIPLDAPAVLCWAEV